MCLAYAGIVLGCTIYSAMAIEDSNNLEKVGLTRKDLSASEQILSDWRSPFLADITIINSKRSCNSIDGFDLFSLTWPGARDLYYRNSRFYKNQCSQTKQIEYEKCRREHLHTAAKAIELDTFGGKRICGIPMRFGGGESSKNGTNYLDVVQPENDGTCPKGYRQCG